MTVFNKQIDMLYKKRWHCFVFFYMIYNKQIDMLNYHLALRHSQTHSEHTPPPRTPCNVFRTSPFTLLSALTIFNKNENFRIKSIDYRVNWNWIFSPENTTEAAKGLGRREAIAMSVIRTPAEAEKISKKKITYYIFENPIGKC